MHSTTVFRRLFFGCVFKSCWGKRELKVLNAENWSLSKTIFFFIIAMYIFKYFHWNSNIQSIFTLFYFRYHIGKCSFIIFSITIFAIPPYFRLRFWFFCLFFWHNMEILQTKFASIQTRSWLHWMKSKKKLKFVINAHSPWCEANWGEKNNLFSVIKFIQIITLVTINIKIYSFVWPKCVDSSWRWSLTRT